MLNIILFGPPGSGKGTQAEKLEEEYVLAHISTGELFRAEMEAGTPLGMEAKTYMERGELVPDAVTIGMLQNRMAHHTGVHGFIFDGFPRTEPQALALEALLAGMGESITALIMLDVPEDEIVRRIMSRGKTAGRPDDNDESVIRNRFQVYLAKTMPLFDFYARQGKAFKISGLGSIDDIFDHLCEVIDRLEA